MALPSAAALLRKKCIACVFIFLLVGHEALAVEASTRSTRERGADSSARSHLGEQEAASATTTATAAFLQALHGLADLMDPHNNGPGGRQK